ncbi:MAG: dTDP-glucose 4,6-dehydratase, partial [bacterium]|nr:dTDP-glucose 4,6-dehydratase [bacterium]
CRAIEACLERGVAGELYNIGGSNERPNIEIVQKLCEMIDERVAAAESLAARFPECPAAKGEASLSLLTHVTDRPGHDRRYAIDFRKAEAELDYEPQETFESGFARTVDWYLDNESWWRGVMDGSYRRWIDSNYASR